MTHFLRTRIALLALSATSLAGCYLGHEGTGGERCGFEVCDEGEQCCPECGGGGRCITLDLPCPPIACADCFSSEDCALSQYCRLAPGTCRGVGTCVDRPTTCTGECSTVCGCDGADYCNECEAAAAGASFDHEGSCGTETCGTRGLVCAPGERCCPLCEGDGLCLAEREPCPDIECSSCFEPLDCGFDQVCMFEPGVCSGPGTCVPAPAGCEDDCPGVCGCDGMTYCNDCVALSAGVSVASAGPCGTPCGRGGDSCSPLEYCDLGPSCGASDAIGCRERPTTCPDVEDPVCGCDGVTYPNACYAMMAGVTPSASGSCEICPDGECGFRTCREVQLGLGGAPSGVYTLTSPDGALFDVYCDMETDGGGWTLVGSTRGRPLADQASDHYADLASASPSSAHRGIWSGLRAILGGSSDVRFTCGGAGFMGVQVDLSFYAVPWYGEWTSGSDAASCFSENNGAGFDSPAPARRDNLGGVALPVGTPWTAGYLEGEDLCADESDFTVDLRDRGMDGNENDGTDWGEDDGRAKCGSSALGPDGFWQVWVREG